MKSSLVIHQTFKLLRRSYSKFNVDTLLSEENKKKTLESFRKYTKLRYGKKDPSRHAAILVPICISPENEISVLYTVRSSKLRTHKGQIAFPGTFRDLIYDHNLLHADLKISLSYIDPFIIFKCAH
jgi:hypothetical protein